MMQKRQIRLTISLVLSQSEGEGVVTSWTRGAKSINTWGSWLWSWSWCHGVMVLWCHGVMASSCHRVMVSWCHGVVVSCCHGVMFSCFHGLMVSWSWCHGHSVMVIVLWCHGIMVSWCHGHGCTTHKSAFLVSLSGWQEMTTTFSPSLA